MTSDIVGTCEIALMLGVSRQRANQLSNEKGFPDPIAQLRMGRIWNIAQVREWMTAKGREEKEWVG